MAETLTAEERWEVVMAQRVKGWRFGRLEDLGASDDAPERVRIASRTLSACARLRAAARGRPVGRLAEDLDLALQLGSDWSRLAVAAALENRERLSLSRPKSSKPRKPRAKTS